MFRWIREAFGHPRGGVHTRIATFCPKAPPPDPRPVEVEFTGRELYSFPEGTSERILEESAALSVRMERARRAFAAPYEGVIHENVVQHWPNGEPIITAEEHDDPIACGPRPGAGIYSDYACRVCGTEQWCWHKD